MCFEDDAGLLLLPLSSLHPLFLAQAEFFRLQLILQQPFHY